MVKSLVLVHQQKHPLHNYYNIKSEIDFIVEDNDLKHGKFLPGVKYQ